MTRNAPARFHWRAFVTLYVTLSFVLLAASGIVLYVAPPGRVANWSRWTLGALDRHGWQAVHTVFALLFVLAGAFHLWFNWRTFFGSIVDLGDRAKDSWSAAGGDPRYRGVRGLADEGRGRAPRQAPARRGRDPRRRLMI